MEFVTKSGKVICCNGFVVVLLQLSLLINGVLCSGVVGIGGELNTPATLINPKSIVKTIKGDGDGEVVHCVDIYKQPAFSHPLLVNHTMQMKPSSYPIELRGTTDSSQSDDFSELLIQSWHKNGEFCPKGTIPIARSKVHPRYTKKLHPKAFSPEQDGIESQGHEHAQVTLEGGNYHGGTGKFNVWNPVTFSPEFSLAQMWVIAGDVGPDLNTVEVGWMVNPILDNDNTSLFIYWTSDGYISTGCYNLDCPGFVQTSNRLAVGTHITKISQYDGQQFESKIVVHKDRTSGNWWLQVQGEEVGYWPVELFKSLSGTATAINWGGEVINTNPEGRHTATQMGSGHFAREGWGKAAFVRNLGYVDEDGNIKDPNRKLITYATRPGCYSVHIGKFDQTYGANFFYGGPGLSPSCNN